MSKQRIAFIGVGLMGQHLARYLLAAGFPVIAHDLEPGKVDAMVKLGATRVGAPADIAAQVDVIMLSLPNSQIVNDVIRNTLQLPQKGRSGQIVVDASTADPTLSAELAAELRLKGIEMLDATISGTSEMAAVKDTIFMVGGKREVYDACEPLFKAMAREWTYMGANGAGAVTKLVVNLVLGLNRMALAEGLTLAK